MTLDEAVVHQPVQYLSYPGGPIEFGRVTEVRGKYVFVLFAGDREAKACRPEDLRADH